VISLCILALTLGLTPQGPGMPDANLLANSEFHSGVSGWTLTGHVTFDERSGLVSLGSMGAKISQERAVTGLRVLTVSAQLAQGSNREGADLKLQCLDALGRVVLDLKQPFDAKNHAGIYFKTQASTTHVIVEIEESGKGNVPVLVHSVRLNDEDANRVYHAPESDLDLAMKPIWQGEKVYEETALLFSQRGAVPTCRLIFRPTEVISVTDSARKIQYREGADFNVRGNEIVQIAGSQIPTMADTEIPKQVFPWLNLAGRHILVTYGHQDRWDGPVPSFAGSQLPHTMAKLRTKAPLKIIAYGDSITQGVNVSGFRGDAPYMPTWVELLGIQLRKLYDDPSIQVLNAGLGGTTAEWGKENATDLVGNTRPDLALIGFGMNDFWSYSPEQFRNNVNEIVTRIRAVYPKCEFILIGSMKFDPDYTSDPAYVNKLPDYAAELRAMRGPGIAYFGMTEMSDALYSAASSKDLGTDPMHPDDFLARWYAQGLVAMLDPHSGSATAKRITRKPETFFLDPKGDDANTGTSPAHSWKSLSRVSREPLAPGDNIVLSSGATFEGSLTLSDEDTGRPDLPIVIRSEGKPATILSTKDSAITAYRGGIEIRNLNLKGGALIARNHHEGITLFARGAEEQRHVRIDHVDISGFGGDGIAIRAEKGGKFGFDDVEISNVKAHGNFGTGINSDDGISADNHGYAHSNFRIIGCDVSGNFSGSGIILSGVDRALVEFCRSSGNIGTGGGVGMWAWCAKDVVFRYCISSGTRTHNGGDGGGFDLDGGCVDCVVEHCLSFDNDGPGYMHCDYPTAPKTMRNSIRDSISVDDGRKPRGDSLGFGFVSWGSGLDYCTIERNLAFVNRSDPLKREDGVFFVSYITGSKAAADVLHVTHCLVKGNVAVVDAPGIAFLRDDLPFSGLKDVLFEDNAFISPEQAPFLVNRQRYDTLNSWKKATGEEQNDLTEVTSPSQRIRGYQSVQPTDLPKFFRR
jgi:lysophospholipase L1-like esterase